MTELNHEDQILLLIAKKAAGNAYSPYSGYKVGAAVRCSKDNYYDGCNVENASFSLTICAERNAIFSAVCAGHKKDMQAIAIYADSKEAFPPCGACRQVIYEFNPNMTVIYANRTSATKTTIAELLPGGFKLKK